MAAWSTAASSAPEAAWPRDRDLARGQHGQRHMYHSGNALDAALLCPFLLRTGWSAGVLAAMSVAILNHDTRLGK